MPIQRFFFFSAHAHPRCLTVIAVSVQLFAHTEKQFAQTQTALNELQTAVYSNSVTSGVSTWV